jgi:alpha-tubulin suppressor-like RCC1 family protein
MNISQFQLLLQEAIDNAGSTMDYLFLARALVSLNMGQIRVVDTFGNLPAAASNEGLLIWVTADERLYWSTGTDWYSIVTTARAQVWSWGSNNAGQLGTNNTINRSSAVSVVGGFSDWCQIDAGNFGVRTNGTLWSWGYNSAGRLGDGTTINRSSPVSILGGFTDWCQVSGGSHTAAVRTNGTAWSWGYNIFGQLGDGTATARSSPVSVVGGFSDWCQISAGARHSVAVRLNGSAWSWGAYRAPGSYGSGLLGDGVNCENKSSPVSVVGGITDWCQINVGRYHTVAVRSSGTAWGWGSNFYGILGDGTATAQSSPVSVVGGFSDWCQISSGSAHSMGLRRSGTAWSWGQNGSNYYGGYGLLGDGTTTPRSSPVSVVGGFNNWCQISAGGFSAVVRVNGTVWTWGPNHDGRLGDGTTTNRSSPVSVVGGFSNWCAVSAGGSHSVALTFDDFV